MNYERFGTKLKIQKNNAKKLYELGLPIILCACKLNPESPWGLCVLVDKKSGESFEKTVAAFEFYNCTNNETGKYAAYYVDIIMGAVFEFKDGSNPWSCYGDLDKVYKEMIKWDKYWNINIKEIRKGIIYGELTEKRVSKADNDTPLF